MEHTRVTLDEKSRDLSSDAEPGPSEADVTRPKRNVSSMSREVRSISSASTPPKVSEARASLPPGTSLAAIFRYHMGIEHDATLVPSHLASKKAIDPIATGSNKGRRAVNLGIYNRCIREERSTSFRFRLWSIVINATLGLQIIFAAILTALGAGNGPGDAVAIFGALNTIIAGFLTYLKGTGLPMRMKYFHNQWLKLRAYIEQRERDFASDDHTGTHRYGYTELMEEVQVIEKMYQNIRKDIEKHTPDSFAGRGQDDSHGPGEGAPPAALAKKGLNAFKAKMSGDEDAGNHAGGSLESRVKNAVEDVEKRLAGHLNNHLAKLEAKSPGKGQASSQDLEAGPGPAMDADAADPDLSDVTDVALARMRQRQLEALEARHAAETRIKELERQLATITDTVTARAP